MVEPVQVAVNRADGVHPSLLLCRHFARLLIQLRHPDSLGAGVFGDFSGVAVAIGPSPTAGCGACRAVCSVFITP